MYIYNNLTVLSNIPSDASKSLCLPFKVCQNMIENIQYVNSYLQMLQKHICLYLM